MRNLSCYKVLVKKDSRLSGVLHVLLHMREMDAPVTSETLAAIMRSNPAAVRRILAGLRRHGFVHSEKGHGGGWTLSCDFSQTTLRDIYTALGGPSLFAMGNRTESPGCLVEQAVNAALGQAQREAERLILDRFAEVTLAALSADFHERLAKRTGTAATKDCPPALHRCKSGPSPETNAGAETGA